MIEYIGKPAMLEQIAEEATELALARIFRAENPTPVTKDEASKNLIEEINEVKNDRQSVQTSIRAAKD